MFDRRKIISFNDALKYAAPPAFNTMVKPVGSLCNLDCVYCYYLDKAGALYKGSHALMTEMILEEYIRQYITAVEMSEVSFLWHGGEPLLAGMKFYETAMRLQRKYAGGKRITNSIQTNGTLLSDEWCRFFHDNDFLVGVSIDGPREIHDARRVNRSGEPTFNKVIEAINRLIRHRVKYNTLSVVSNLSEGRGTEIYLFLKSLGSRYMQFLPVVEHILQSSSGERPVIVVPDTPGSVPAPWNVSAKGYGRFMTDIFDIWVVRDVGSWYVQDFDMTLVQWVGAKPGLCVYAETCGDALAVEHNGDVYSCDHFVYPEYRLGNIMERELRDMYLSPEQFEFGINKRNNLPDKCLRCRFYFACRGECPKHRFLKSETGEGNLNALCEGFLHYFSHVAPYMDEMRRLILAKKAPSHVMEWAQRRLAYSE